MNTNNLYTCNKKC